MLVKTNYEHISLNDKNVPIIAGTKMKVVELVLDSKAYGWSPEELHFQHPYLKMGQIYSGLAYYWEHRLEIDQDIERRIKLVDHLKDSFPPTAVETRLKQQGLI